MSDNRKYAFAATLSYAERKKDLPENYTIENLICDADKIAAYFDGDMLRALGVAPVEETSVDIVDKTTPPESKTLPGGTASIPNGTSASTVGTYAGDPKPAQERKPRGPNKRTLAKQAKEAKKAERAKRKAEKAEAGSAEAATVAEGEKDAPFANGAGEHAQPKPADEPQPMVA